MQLTHICDRGRARARVYVCTRACVFHVVACQPFPMHRFTDTFDDVIDTAVAIGAIGSGPASLALRGGVNA